MPKLHKTLCQWDKHGVASHIVLVILSSKIMNWPKKHASKVKLVLVKLFLNLIICINRKKTFEEAIFHFFLYTWNTCLFFGFTHHKAMECFVYTIFPSTFCNNVLQPCRVKEIFILSFQQWFGLFLHSTLQYRNKQECHINIM